jgi:uncharacterized protein YktB (UPF0637 family)
MAMKGREHEKFNRYMAELQNVLQTLMVGRLPAGYEREDLTEIENILKKYKMREDMYQKSIEACQDIQAVQIEETIERIADIEKAITQAKDQIRREQEQAKEARAMAAAARRAAKEKGAEPKTKEEKPKASRANAVKPKKREGKEEEVL